MVAIAASGEEAKNDRGTSKPSASMAARNNRRSSATRMVSSRAPISLVPLSRRMPVSASLTARFNAVCPPTVGSNASGRSRSMIFATAETVSGSI
jgi:hypothetical protein